MSAHCHPVSHLHWGIMDNKPPLPDGWKYIEAIDNFVRAVGPDGRKWFAGGKTLVLCGQDAEGNEIYDTRETINL